MRNLLSTVTPVLLMGPGPSMVYPSVYAAMTTPLLGHLDGEFIALMDTIKSQLRTVCGTTNEVTMPMSGTGSAGMETCFVNLVEKGDSVLILHNGVFSGRMIEVATRLGAQVESLDFAWGTPVLPEAVAKKLATKHYDIVAVVHAETSTGVCSPVDAIGKLVKAHGALYLVDGVTSLGGIRVALDEWGVDAFYSGTQKCLSCPPGLSPVSFGEAALEKIRNRSTKVPNWYLDMSLIMNYWEGHSRAYHHTAPISMNYALYAALHTLLEEGLDAAFARHQAAHEMLVDGLESLGFSMYVEKGYRLPMLNVATCPEGLDEAALRKRLRNEFSIEVGAGLGPLAGKVIRIGLMGATAKPEYVNTLLAAMERCLKK